MMGKDSKDLGIQKGGLIKVSKKEVEIDVVNENNVDLLDNTKKIFRKSNRQPILTKKEKKELGIGRDCGRAEYKYARISSRKVKIVIDLIKNKKLDDAYAILQFTPKAASQILYKLLKSAEANAVNNNNLERDYLYVADAFANQGPTLRRIMPRAQGRAYRIKKRTSHITLILQEQND